MARHDTPSPPPAARVVLLGASNLARGIGGAVRSARAAAGAAPVELLIARGHGRSYGAPSRVLGRTLPGILECGIWDAIDRARVEPAFALVTDIGNDVAYGVDVDRVAAWIDACLERLAAAGAVTAVSALPMASLERMSAAQFRLFKAILFPGRPITLAEALARSRALDDRVRALARRRGAHLVEHQADWYGLDPVHIRRSRLAAAWGAMTGPWREGREPAPVAGPSAALRLRLWRPAAWSLAGLRLGSRQPAGRLANGSPVSMY